jgi:hypothetical protein
MKNSQLLIRIIALLPLLLISGAYALQEKTQEQRDYDTWLKQRFSAQHEQLIPVVAVADMYFTCNKKHQVDQSEHSIKYLIVKMERDVLAQKLVQCLDGEDMQSDTALNYGLQGCFSAQLAKLNSVERQKKMTLVKKAILSLSREERKKSFTHCVTDQAIGYLK